MSHKANLTPAQTSKEIIEVLGITTSNYNEFMTKAMHCAIQDQYTLVTWLEETAHAGSEAEIEACKADIRDFELVLAYYDDSLMAIPIYSE